MSQAGALSGSGSGGGVASITGTSPIEANGVSGSPETGAVTLSILDATTTTVGVASFPSTYFSVSGAGAVTPTNFTITAGTGLSGGGSLTLGGSVTLTNAGATSISATAPITASASTGSITIALTTPLSGAFGGTGVANTGLTINLGSGGTGKVLTSDSSGNGTWQVSSGGVTSISGTANQIVASASTGAVTLSFPTTGNGISIGSYQATSPPANGIICAGSVGIGTTSVTNTLLNLVNTGNAYTIQTSGIMTAVDGSSNMYGCLLANPMTPTSGATSANVLFADGLFVAPMGQTIATAAAIHTETIVSSNVGTITNLYGIVIGNASKTAGGTVTNSYGLYVGAPQAATNIYTAYFDPGVGIGAVNPTTSSAALSITSTTQGFLEPVMTTTQQNAITSPATGLQIYNSSFEGPAFYNGSQWVQVGMQLISKQVLGAPAASVTFSSIPQVFNHLKLIMVAQNDTSFNDAVLTVNSVASGYDYISSFFSGTGSFESNNLNQASFDIGPTPQNSNASPGMLTIDFPFYTLTTFNKTIYSYTSANSQSATSYVQWHGGSNRSTTAISTIKIQPGAGNFVTGSAFCLYGIN